VAKVKKKFVYYEEYGRCSCTFIADKKDELPGYCPRHFTDKKRRVRLLDMGFERGLVGSG